MNFGDVRRQRFKARVGWSGVTETPREFAFCAATFAGESLLEVSGALLDTRFGANLLVTGAPLIRFHASFSLALPASEKVGTLCVIDHRPRRLTWEQARTLVDLARLAADALAMRQQLTRGAPGAPARSAWPSVTR